MPKAELGDKHLCDGCGAKFYDMKKTPPTCPACGAVVEIETKRKSRGAAATPAAKKVPLVAKPKDELVDDDELVVDDVEDIEDDDDDAADLLPDEDEDDDLNDVGVAKPGGSDDEDD